MLINGSAINGGIINGEGNAASIFTVTGGAFSSSLNATIADTDIYVSGVGAFASSLAANFGTDVAGGTFSTVLASTLSDTAYYTVTGGAFNSELSAAILGTELFTISGGSFTSALTGQFGADIAGGSFASSLSAVISSPSTLSVSGGAFVSVVNAVIQDIGVFAVSGGSFNTTMLSFDVAGGAFQSSLSATISDDFTNAIAYVLNIHTGESTRYTNMAFNQIITIGTKSYGVKTDGLYLLEGATDNGTAINGTITTKDTDFGSYQSKRCQYAFLNSDTATRITPIVDGVTKNTHTSKFSGRKTQLALGNAGRYWQFHIQDIKALQGLEILPEQQQRRVK